MRGGDPYRESAKYELPDRSTLDQSAWQHQRSCSNRRWVSRAHLALRLRNSSLSLSPALCTDVFVLAAHPFLRRRLPPTRPAVTMSLPCPCGWASVNLPFPGGLECLSVSDLVISGIGGSRPCGARCTSRSCCLGSTMMAVFPQRLLHELDGTVGSEPVLLGEHLRRLILDLAAPIVEDAEVLAQQVAKAVVWCLAFGTIRRVLEDRALQQQHHQLLSVLLLLSALELFSGQHRRPRRWWL